MHSFIPILEQHTCLSLPHVTYTSPIHLSSSFFPVTYRAAVAFQEGTGRRIADGFQALAQFLAGLVIAFTQSWRLSLVLLAGLPLIGGAAATLGAVMSESKSARGIQYAKAGGIAAEALGAIRTVASLCAGKEATYISLKSHCLPAAPLRHQTLTFPLLTHIYRASIYQGLRCVFDRS